MSNVVNLNKFRKSKARAEQRKSADENAVKFGRSKELRQIEAARRDKDKRDLDGHERE